MGDGSIGVDSRYDVVADLESGRAATVGKLSVRLAGMTAERDRLQDAAIIHYEPGQSKGG